MEAHKVAIYARVSSDEQRENQTIQTQIDVAKQWVDLQRVLEVPMSIHDFYLDDGVSGTVPFEKRPGGERLLADAAAHKFEMVLVYKVDRLGRDQEEILRAARQIEHFGVMVKGMRDEIDRTSSAGRFMFGVLAAQASYARESLIERSVEATNHWAREGAWLSGIVPYGYKKIGIKKEARLEVSETPLPRLTLSEADVIRMIYRMLADEGRSCIYIANHLNALGVPPHYTKDERQVRRPGPDGKRKQRTAGVWRPSRIRNMVVEPIYKGVHFYGRRSKKLREVIRRTYPAIVSLETWAKAQQALVNNRRFAPRGAKRKYLLRGLVKCSVCGLTYSGTASTRPNGKVDIYYKCNGKDPNRGLLPYRCPSLTVRAGELEAAIWADVERFLHDPGPVLEQLTEALSSGQEQSRDLNDERAACDAALSKKQDEKQRILDLYRREIIDADDLERQLEKIGQEAAELTNRLQSLETTLHNQELIDRRIVEAQDLLYELRERLTDDFAWEEKREIVEALVLEIQVNTIEEEDNKRFDIMATYAFDGCAATHMDRDLLQRQE